MGVTLYTEPGHGSAAGTRLTISANLGAPVGDLAAPVRREIQPCWRATPPA